MKVSRNGMQMLEEGDGPWKDYATNDRLSQPPLRIDCAQVIKTVIQRSHV